MPTLFAAEFRVATDRQRRVKVFAELLLVQPHLGRRRNLARRNRDAIGSRWQLLHRRLFGLYGHFLLGHRRHGRREDDQGKDNPELLN